MYRSPRVPYFAGVHETDGCFTDHHQPLHVRPQDRHRSHSPKRNVPLHVDGGTLALTKHPLQYRSGRQAPGHHRAEFCRKEHSVYQLCGVAVETETTLGGM